MSVLEEQAVKSTPSARPFLATRKRTGEWFIERSITLIAGVCIALIFLILLFVLREAYPLFITTVQESQSETAVTKTSDASKLSPEIYNPDIIVAEHPSKRTLSTTLKPEVYNPDIHVPHTNNKQHNHDGQPQTVSESSVWDNLLGAAWQPVGINPKFGLLPLLTGTAKTTFVAIIIGAPLGILAALYAAFFAPKKIREFIKPLIEILAGFPSVVIGFFCLFFVGSLFQTITGSAFRLNALVGGIGLAIAVIPIVFTITEDALSAVPKTLLEASLAMGSTTWEAAYKVMLPAAFPGVFAAVLLGIGRAFGETMIALMATGNAALHSINITDPVRTLSATIGAEMGEVIWGSQHYNILFFLGLILFFVSFVLNAITEFYVKERLAKKLQGM